MRSVPRICEFNPGICLTTEENHGKTSTPTEKEKVIPETHTYTEYEFTFQGFKAD